jgi:hypothetical protein
MKGTLAATSWLVAFAFLVGAAAQTPQPPAERPQAKEADEKTVTLTGCLAPGDQPKTFRLTSIRTADKAAPKPGEMVGTTGLMTGESVDLIGTDAAKLEAHVGHTISVTGMLMPRKEGYAAAPAKPETLPAKEKPTMNLNVKAFKHVDATCQPIGR